MQIKVHRDEINAPHPIGAVVLDTERGLLVADTGRRGGCDYSWHEEIAVTPAEIEAITAAIQQSREGRAARASAEYYQRTDGTGQGVVAGSEHVVASYPEITVTIAASEYVSIRYSGRDPEPARTLSI